MSSRLASGLVSGFFAQERRCFALPVVVARGTRRSRESQKRTKDDEPQLPPLLLMEELLHQLILVGSLSHYL